MNRVHVGQGNFGGQLAQRQQHHLEPSTYTGLHQSVHLLHLLRKQYQVPVLPGG